MFKWNFNDNFNLHVSSNQFFFFQELCIFFFFGNANTTQYGNSSYCKYDQCKKKRKNEYVSLLIEFWVRMRDEMSLITASAYVKLNFGS